MAVRIQFRRGTSTEWYNANPILADGEIGYESDTKVIKFGDGTTSWRNLAVAAAGDITAVIAGTGLTGGATSGQATLSVDPSYVVTSAAIDAKGDMIIGTAADNYTRLPVGSDGSIVVADSTSPTGVRWAQTGDGYYPTPAGVVTAYAGTVPPNGYLLCNGAAVSRATYSRLFTAIGTTYGTGDGSSTFNIPNLSGRVIVARDGGQTEFDTVSEIGGTKAHTLTTSELPIHDHTYTNSPSDGSHSHSASTVDAGNHQHIQQDFVTDDNYYGFLWQYGYGWEIYRARRVRVDVANSTANTGFAGTHSHTVTVANGGTHTHNVTIGNTGGSSAHNNLQPYMVMNYIIKV